MNPTINNRYQEATLEWLTTELLTKFETRIVKVDWKFCQPKHLTPVQSTSFDCGLFVIMFTDFLMDDLPLSFDQSHMDALRTKVGTDLMRKKLLY
jgi:Ulp1 family protease